jgi:hypothetical protein
VRRVRVRQQRVQDVVRERHRLRERRLLREQRLQTEADERHQRDSADPMRLRDHRRRSLLRDDLRGSLRLVRRLRSRRNLLCSLRSAGIGTRKLHELRPHLRRQL